MPINPAVNYILYFFYMYWDIFFHTFTPTPKLLVMTIQNYVYSIRNTILWTICCLVCTLCFHFGITTYLAFHYIHNKISSYFKCLPLIFLNIWCWYVFSLYCCESRCMLPSLGRWLITKNSPSCSCYQL